MSKRPADRALDTLDDHAYVAQLEVENARLRRDLLQVDGERLLALKHCGRHREMLENNDNCVRCEGCEQLWPDSSCGVDGNSEVCKTCKEFWCADCLIAFGGGCSCTYSGHVVNTTM